jgi:hypothetical protein
MVIFSNFKISFTLAILTPILYFLRKLSLAIKELVCAPFHGLLLIKTLYFIQFLSFFVKGTVQRKLEGSKLVYQSIPYDVLSCRQVSFTLLQGTPSREEHKRYQRLYFFDAILTGRVVTFLSGQIFLWIFCCSVGWR